MSRHRSAACGRRGAVLILVLWLVIVLGVLGISYSASVRSQLSAAEMTRGRTEAYWAARAGIDKAMAMLAEADLSTLSGTDDLFDSRADFEDHAVGAATFSLPAEPDEPGGATRFGISDTAARLNINTATEAMLMELPAMTIELAHTLLDWRDPDHEAREAGAEIEYYQSLPHPYVPRNGPLHSVRELMRVKGWDEVFAAAYPDPYLRFSGRPESSAFDPVEARRLLGRLTAWSVDPGLAPDGEPKIHLNSATEEEIRRRVGGLNDDQIKAIVAHDNYNSPLDLFDVEAAQDEDDSGKQGQTGEPGGPGPEPGRGPGGGGWSTGPGGPGGGSGTPPGGGGQGGGSNEKIFDLQKVAEIIDYFTAQRTPDTDAEAGSSEGPGKINLNTAGQAVLMTIPGMSEDLALSIVRERESRGRIYSAGRIADIGGLGEDAFKEIYPWIMTETNRFFVRAEGREAASRARVRIDAVLAVNADGVYITYWREH